MKGKLHIFLCVACVSLAVGLTACTSVRDARATIAQADSLLAAGEIYDDSATLAKAVDALRPWQVFAATDYAKACFYLGRLLRTEGYYSAAMPYLLDARHARTNHSELIGRVYSNIAYMCRLEGNYPLAYDMYVCSAEAFLAAGDTTRYLIGQTNMAYALAEQGDTAGVRALLEPIEQGEPSAALAAMCYETYAEGYLRAEDYMQGLRYADRAIEAQGETPSVVTIKAQCFSLLEQYDSATCYAQQVLKSTDHLFLRANALYILTQEDSAANLSDVRQAAAERAMVLRQIADNQGDLARAVEMLQQDLNSHPRRWGALVIGVMCLAVALLAWWRVMRRQHRKYMIAREKQNAQLQQQYAERRQKIEQEVTQNIDALLHADDWRKTLYWNDYEQFCGVVNKQFFLLADKLKAKGTLNEKELRLCVLVLMDCFDSKQLATLLHYGESGVRNYKQHTANKLGTNSRELREQLIKMMTGEA